MEQLYTTDDYFTTEQIFNVLGYDVVVKSELVAEALENLPKRKRDIIPPSYFLDLSDREIGDELNLIRATVQYQRTSTLKLLHKYLEKELSEVTKMSRKTNNLLSYQIIVLAANGDIEAINMVIVANNVDKA